MPTPDAITTEKERIYSSSSLRDDLNDAEATVLLEWGESQLQRLAEVFPDEFEAKARFLRQLLKNINRFVGQREFNDMTGQAKYMSKISMYLEPLGWENLSSDDLFNALPEDKADMSANLIAIIRVLSPKVAEEVPSDAPSNPDVIASGADIIDEMVEPIMSQAQNIAEQLDALSGFDDIAQDKPDDTYKPFNRPSTNHFLEADSDYDQEKE